MVGSAFSLVTTHADVFLVGWIATLRELADIFHLPGFNTLHIIMAILMCITWAVLFILTIVAFAQGHIFQSMPEDVVKDSVRMSQEMEEVQRGGSSV